MKNFNTKKMMNSRKTAISYRGIVNVNERYLQNYTDAMHEYQEQMKALNKLVEKAQEKARVRKIEPIMIVNALIEADSKLACIRKKALTGCKITVDCNAQDFPNAYNGTPESTIFEAVYRNGAWVITNIYRGRTHPSNARHIVDLPQEAVEDIIRTYTRF